MRARCLKDPQQKTTRQVYFFKDRAAGAPETYSRKMQRKIDSEDGRHIYSQRLGTVEPVFGHLHNIGLNRFSLRGKKKVDHQWRLFCLVHNMLKIHRYATCLAEKVTRLGVKRCRISDTDQRIALRYSINIAQIKYRKWID